MNYFITKGFDTSQLCCGVVHSCRTSLGIYTGKLSEKLHMVYYGGAGARFGTYPEDYYGMC